MQLPFSDQYQDEGGKQQTDDAQTRNYGYNDDCFFCNERRKLSQISQNQGRNCGA